MFWTQDVKLRFWEVHRLVCPGSLNWRMSIVVEFWCSVMKEGDQEWLTCKQTLLFFPLTSISFFRSSWFFFNTSPITFSCSPGSSIGRDRSGLPIVIDFSRVWKITVSNLKFRLLVELHFISNIFYFLSVYAKFQITNDWLFQFFPIEQCKLWPVDWKSGMIFCEHFLWIDLTQRCYLFDLNINDSSHQVMKWRFYCTYSFLPQGTFKLPWFSYNSSFVRSWCLNILTP